jgi:hypothetical protein
MAAQHFGLTIVDSSVVTILLTPVNSDWFESFVAGRSDPTGYQYPTGPSTQIVI